MEAGRREAEQGQTSDAASFYVMAQAAMSRCQSRLAADAHASSGTRESQDLCAWPSTSATWPNLLQTKRSGTSGRRRPS